MYPKLHWVKCLKEQQELEQEFSFLVKIHQFCKFGLGVSNFFSIFVRGGSFYKGRGFDPSRNYEQACLFASPNTSSNGEDRVRKRALTLKNVFYLVSSKSCDICEKSILRNFSYKAILLKASLIQGIWCKNGITPTVIKGSDCRARFVMFFVTMATRQTCQPPSGRNLRWFLQNNPFFVTGSVV